MPQDKPIVVHCKAGVRSAEVLAVLKDAGFSDAVHVGGGIVAWVSEIEPEKSDLLTPSIELVATPQALDPCPARIRCKIRLIQNSGRCPGSTWSERKEYAAKNAIDHACMPSRRHPFAQR